MTTSPSSEWPLDWWDAARWTSCLTVSELAVPPTSLDHLQAATLCLVELVSTDSLREPLPRGSHLVVASHPGGEAVFECICLPAESGHRQGVRLVPPDAIHPLDRRWAAERGWDLERGIAIPWIRDARDQWHDPSRDDVCDLLAALRWLQYQRRVDRAARHRVA